jgi:HEPN domain-containing protein
MKKDEIEKLISEIDWELQQEEVPVARRVLEACSRFSLKTGMNFPMSEDNLIFRTINNWYKIGYGDKLLVDFSPGSGVITLGREPYLVKFPRVGKAKVSPFKWIQDATPRILNSIPEEMVPELARSLMLQFNNYQTAELLPPVCTDDLHSAVDHIVAKRRNYGLSKWASQQSLEKTFKHYISEKGDTYERIHDLGQLHNQCIALDLPALPAEIVKTVECDPSARYLENGQDKDYTLEVAVTAFNNSLHCVGHVARSLLNLPMQPIRFFRD